MPKWTRQQDDVLWEHGHEGAERCAAIIRHRFGVSRKPDAVRRHAYRIGAPMVRYEICTGCGRRTVEISRRSGLCPICHQRELASRQKEFNRQVLMEARSLKQSDEYRNAKREYDRYRKENSTICRKYGLRGKRARESGDSVDLSQEMSNACSEA